MSADANVNFSGFPSGYNPFAAISQAMAPQMPGTPPSFPQMSAPQAQGYGPMHSALAQALAQALQQQAGGGLLGSVSPQQMGLLSTQMNPASAVGMPIKGGTSLGNDQYYRLTPTFWKNTANSLGAASAEVNPMDSFLNEPAFNSQARPQYGYTSTNLFGFPVNSKGHITTQR